MRVTATLPLARLPRADGVRPRCCAGDEGRARTTRPPAKSLEAVDGSGRRTEGCASRRATQTWLHASGFGLPPPPRCTNQTENDGPERPGAGSQPTLRFDDVRHTLGRREVRGASAPPGREARSTAPGGPGSGCTGGRRTAAQAPRVSTRHRHSKRTQEDTGPRTQGAAGAPSPGELAVPPKSLATFLVGSNDSVNSCDQGGFTADLIHFNPSHVCKGVISYGTDFELNEL